MKNRPNLEIEIPAFEAPKIVVGHSEHSITISSKIKWYEKEANAGREMFLHEVQQLVFPYDKATLPKFRENEGSKLNFASEIKPRSKNLKEFINLNPNYDKPMPGLACAMILKFLFNDSDNKLANYLVVPDLVDPDLVDPDLVDPDKKKKFVVVAIDGERIIGSNYDFRQNPTKEINKINLTKEFLSHKIKLDKLTRPQDKIILNNFSKRNVVEGEIDAVLNNIITNKNNILNLARIHMDKLTPRAEKNQPGGYNEEAVKNRLDELGGYLKEKADSSRAKSNSLRINTRFSDYSPRTEEFPNTDRESIISHSSQKLAGQYTARSTDSFESLLQMTSPRSSSLNSAKYDKPNDSSNTKINTRVEEKSNKIKDNPRKRACSSPPRLQTTAETFASKKNCLSQSAEENKTHSTRPWANYIRNRSKSNPVLKTIPAFG